MAANGHRVLVLQGGRITRGDNSHKFLIRDININPQDPYIKKSPLTKDIQATINNFDNLQLIIINAHGDPWSHAPNYSISFWDQTKNLSLASSWEFEKLEKLFLAIRHKFNRPINICVFACHAGSGSTKELVELLPKGSLVGFYNPKIRPGRMEASAWQIHKILDMWRNGNSPEKILWQVTPHCQCFIACNHPTNGFSEDALPTINFNENFSYQFVRSTGNLETIRQTGLNRYNNFLQNNNSPLRTFAAIDINAQENHYKDLWFIQMVIELTTDPQKKQAALAYLQNVNQDLRGHTMQLANIPYRCNLADYFLSYYHHNNQNSPNDLDLFKRLHVFIPSTYHNRLTQYGKNAFQDIQQEQNVAAAQAAAAQAAAEQAAAAQATAAQAAAAQAAAEQAAAEQAAAEQAAAEQAAAAQVQEQIPQAQPPIVQVQHGQNPHILLAAPPPHHNQADQGPAAPGFHPQHG